MNYIKIEKHSDTLLRVNTKYNELEVHIDPFKGIGIYLICEGKGILIKQYNHLNLKTALNYILKLYTNFI